MQENDKNAVRYILDLPAAFQRSIYTNWSTLSVEYTKILFNNQLSLVVERIYNVIGLCIRSYYECGKWDEVDIESIIVKACSKEKFTLQTLITYSYDTKTVIRWGNYEGDPDATGHIIGMQDYITKITDGKYIPHKPYDPGEYMDSAEVAGAMELVLTNIVSEFILVLNIPESLKDLEVPDFPGILMNVSVDSGVIVAEILAYTELQ